jgi:hypothetical protein
MKISRHVAAIAVSILLTACASTRQYLPIEPASPEVTISRFPELGVISTRELGDTLSSYIYEVSYDAAEILNKVRTERLRDPNNPLHIPSVMFDIPPQEVVLKGYFGDHAVWSMRKCVIYNAGNFDAPIESAPCPAIYLTVKRGSEEVKIAHQTLDNSTKDLAFINSDVKPSARFYKTADPTRPSFRQELIYNGRIGSQVKFLYRELSNDLLRGSFNQDVQYDLTEGPVIGFKGLRLEIEEATNTKIKYRVIKGFTGAR